METIVKLGKVELVLEKPASLAVMQDIMIATHTNPTRAMYAALGVCSPKLCKRLKVAYKFNPLEFGGQIYDGLIKVKVPGLEITQASSTAFHFVVAGMVSEREVSEKEDFLEDTPNTESPEELSF